MKTIINRFFNNQMLKCVCHFMLGALAVLMVSCNDSLEVGIIPTNPPQPPVVVYDTAEGSYNGDILGNGTAFFMLDLFHSSDPNNGTSIMGFCTLPSSSANFRLDAGTYNIASTGNIRTLFPGMMGDNVKIGTFRYDITTGNLTWITSGAMTVSLSGNTYTIQGYFTGEDAVTGIMEGNIRFSYTGTIDFTEPSFSFEDIGNSTYVATGTPRWLDPPRSSTWSGTLEAVEVGNEKKYKINNWGNEGNSSYVYCTYRDGKIYLDNTTIVAGNSTYNGYFQIGYLNTNGILTVLTEREHEISYNKTTRIMDFGGTVTISSGTTYPALAGIAAFNKTTDVFGSVFSDFYENLKIQLTPTQTNVRSASVQPSDRITDLLENMDFTRQSVMPVSNSKPIVVKLEELDQDIVKTTSLQDREVVSSQL